MTLAALGWTERRSEEFEPHLGEGLLPGRIIGEHRTHYVVATNTAELNATLAGRLRNQAGQRSDLPGVGDFVAIRPAAGDGPATIEAVLLRTTALVRKAAGEERPQLLAANVDVIFIVMALDGDFSLPRLARYLSLVQSSGATPVIIANKTDLSDDVAARIAEIGSAAPGVRVHAITARNTGVARELEKYFDDNRTIALIGSSGVGKSTLTNQLLGREAQATQEVRSHDDRGRHTTTHRQLFLRPRGGSVMDTPGMRGLELWGSEAKLAPDFADIEALSSQCKFRNCKHGPEPGCAVRAAIERGDLDPVRLANYVGHTGASSRSRR